MDVRTDLSVILLSDLKEQKLKLRESECTSEVVDKAHSAMEPALSKWLEDCADVDTITKVKIND